jgi:hypothetical protein
MGSNVDKIVGGILEKLKPLVRDAVQQADADARTEVLANVSKAIGGNGKTTVAATPTKRRPGRPKKTATSEAAPAKKVKANKPKRQVSEEVRAKLAENLKKAREAKAEKAKPAKKVKAKPAKKKAAAEPAPAEQAS